MTILRTPTPLTPAAAEILRYSLETLDDEVGDCDDEAWPPWYPRLARSLSRAQVREMIADMLDALSAPELYQATDYHWMIVYDAARYGVADINEYQISDLDARLDCLWQEGDRGYLRVRGRRKPRPRVRIDWEEFLETFFWDLDFMLLAEEYDGLTLDQKRMLGVTPELFGLIHGLKPAPEELRLTPVPPEGAAETAP